MNVLTISKGPDMLNNRPKELFEIPHYQGPPLTPVGVRMDGLPGYLNFDLQFELQGIRPNTQAVSDLSPEGLCVNPNQAVIDYYVKRKTKFQMIFVVFNCATFEGTDEGSHIGTPYSIRLFPATKRHHLDEREIRHVTLFNLEDLPIHETVYAGFDPFEGTWEISGPYGFIAQNRRAFSDSVGFITGAYFLATDAELNDVLMPTPFHSEPELFIRFHKFRAKKYYTPFTDTRPRPVWGCESPIELYLFQALLHRGLHPIPQVLILRDGSIYPSYHHMYENRVFPNGDALASTPDLYFPDQRVAVYCDSAMHHRGGKARIKDEQISERVHALGIKPVRVNGKTIVKDLDAAVAQVLAHL